MLHGKLLLLRSRTGGLRIVVSGNNFYREQWNEDRDILWIQDFPYHVLQLTDNTGKAYIGQFEARLREYLRRTTQCSSTIRNDAIQQRISALFQGVNFSNSRASFVYSFPATPIERGGWRQLANTVRELRDDLESDEDSDCEDDDMDCNNTLTPVMYATSGSIGHLKPDFLLQMYRSMHGNEAQASKETEWNDILSTCQSTGLVRIMWPSTTAKHLALSDECRRWYEHVPEMIKRNCFYDAQPSGRTHGKTMYTTIPTKNGSSRTSVLYIGSHNLSENAWGKRGSQGNNVEIGVVLVTASPSIDQQWRASFPCTLPDESESGEDYARAMKKKKPSADATIKSVVPTTDLIDLCDSE